MKRAASKQRAGKSVVLVGLGNIGSQFVEHVACMEGVVRVTLVDKDDYEEANLQSQRITRRDLGRSKVAAQARRLREMNPSIVVTPIREDVANIPLGRLRGDVIIAGVDSLQARIRINEIAWRLGVPWIDGGVEPASHLVRLNAYQPSASSPCLECALDESDYQQLGSRHPCGPDSADVAPTNGSTSLGALAAALLAIECQKLLTGAKQFALISRQVVLDALHHRHFLTTFRHNPRCRFDHAVWEIKLWRRMSVNHTLAEAIAAARKLTRASDAVSLRIDGHPLVRALHCPGCGHCVNQPHLLGRLGRPEQGCPRCGKHVMLATGFKIVESLDKNLPTEILRKPLRRFGFQPGDVVTVTCANHELHLVIPHERM